MGAGVHRYMQRLQACEASGWEPFARGEVRDTQVFHTGACSMRRRGQCNCAGQIRVVLTDGRHFQLDSAGLPQPLPSH